MQNKLTLSFVISLKSISSTNGCCNASNGAKTSLSTVAITELVG